MAIMIFPGAHGRSSMFLSQPEMFSMICVIILMLWSSWSLRIILDHVDHFSISIDSASLHTDAATMMLLDLAGSASAGWSCRQIWFQHPNGEAFNRVVCILTPSWQAKMQLNSDPNGINSWEKWKDITCLICPAISCIYHQSCHDKLHMVTNDKLQEILLSWQARYFSQLLYKRYCHEGQDRFW